MAALLSPDYLGLYVVAVSAANVSQVLSQAVQMVSTPSIARRESPEERAAVLQAVFRRYWMLSFLIALALGLALPVAIPIVFGANFKEAVWPAEVLLVGTFFIGAKEVLSGGAQALGNPWLGSKAHALALIVTVGLLCLLLPAIGIMGAAMATAAASLSQLAVVAQGLRKVHGILLIDLFRFKAKDITSAVGLLELIRGLREQLAPGQR
jgi:O-antigen/teichoic acid export membrane protein